MLTTTKRSYDYSFANEDRDYTFAMSTHSFHSQYPHTSATQAAPSVTNHSHQARPSYLAELPLYLDHRRSLLGAAANFYDDLQSNAATPKVESLQADSYFSFRPEPGTTGLGIRCDSVVNQPVYTVPDVHPVLKQEEIFLGGFSELCSPIPGGFLELLTKLQTEPAEIRDFARVPTAYSSHDVLDSGTAVNDTLTFFRSDSSVLSSLPSLQYPSSSELFPGDSLVDIPLFYSSGSESNVKGTLGSTSLYPSSSTEASVNNSPVKTPLFYPSSSFGSAEDTYSAAANSVSSKSLLPNFLDLDSPLLGQGHEVSAEREQAIVGLYADINLRAVPTRHDAPETCVNPADVMGQEELAVKMEEEQEVAGLLADCEQSDIMEYEQDGQPSTGLEVTGFNEEAVQAIVSVITAAKQEDVRAVSPCLPPPADAPAPVLDLQGVPPPIIPQPTHFPFAPPPVPPVDVHAPPAGVTPAAQFIFATALDYAPYSFFSSSLTALSAPQRTPLLGRQPPPAFAQHVQVHAHASPVSYYDAAAHAPHPQTPICNAHMGVELEELRRRAEDFRRRNPGMDIDKAWLQAFAGRLSDDGVLIEEWRCYVKGCTQRNKRRDHILVHVGSHVEHRPFSCSRCGMRFLRKNECKRHEASHDGTKPYECAICAPLQHRSFARQDLLKRHMRVTHGAVSEPGRKRMRMDDGEYQP
ncbi:hypothetical protein DAEQUDRAFT_807439 [Daedalea quercina L-15889]|uniref:C2H2-type domain-containing protein n=1 Tax=Daedalea quercina L-15889 TaxID=1314783 RepID=A0A165U238_9APHY|nr:hypothetical protein DAEQUDRAFT_807439 [Daedalea quercina L-15889]